MKSLVESLKSNSNGRVNESLDLNALKELFIKSMEAFRKKMEKDQTAFPQFDSLEECAIAYYIATVTGKEDLDLSGINADNLGKFLNQLRDNLADEARDNADEIYEIGEPIGVTDSVDPDDISWYTQIDEYWDDVWKKMMKITKINKFRG